MRHIAAFTLATAIAAPAFAGGPVVPIEEPALEPVYEQPVRADGNWTGPYVGAQLGYGDVGSNGAGLDGNGAIGGVHAGYRLDYGTFVGGAELDYDTSNIDLGTTGKLDSVTRLKLQAGYDMGQTLVYATGGAAYGKATVGGVGLSDTGYFLGVGADYALTDNWVLGGEVLRHRFSNFDSTGIKLDATTAKLKVSYRF